MDIRIFWVTWSWWQPDTVQLNEKHPARRLDAKTRKCRVDFFAIGARLRHDSARGCLGVRTSKG